MPDIVHVYHVMEIVEIFIYCLLYSLFYWRLGLFHWSSSSNCCEQSKVLSRGTHRQPGNCWTNMSDVAIILTLSYFLGRESEHGGAKCGWDPKTFGQDQGPSILDPDIYSYHSSFPQLDWFVSYVASAFGIWNLCHLLVHIY